MAQNSYDVIVGHSGSTSDDPIQNAFNNYATYYGEGNTGLQDTIIGNWFNPGIVQDKEFAQQVALQRLQNEWNAAPNQMEQMKKAGINANVAAAGIAGAGNAPSAGSPNSAVGAGAAGLGAAAQAAGALNDTVNAGVNAYEKFSLTSAEKDRKKAEVANLLASAFHNEWLGRAVAEMLPLQKDNERADTWLKLANFDKAREEKKLINKRIDETTAHINELNKQADLFEKQGNLVDAEKLRVQAQTDQIKLENDKLQWDKDFREKWHFDNTKPIDNAIIEAMAFEDGDALGSVKTIGQSIEYLSKQERKGFNAAEIEDGYRKAFEEYKAKNDVDADFAPYFAAVEANKKGLIEFLKFVYENPDDFGGIVGKFITYISSLGTSLDVIHGRVNNAKKPVSGSPNAGRW